MNIAGLSTLFLRLCMYNNLLDSLRKKYNHLLPTEYKKISYKDCYNNISKIQTFTFLSKKTQNEIKEFLEYIEDIDIFIIDKIILFLSKTESLFITRNIGESQKFFFNKLFKEDSFILIYSFSTGIGGDESKYFIEDFNNLIKYMLQDLIENNVIVELKFVDETIKEMLNKNNTKIYNINIKKTSYDFDHFLNIAGILSFINIIRVQREPVNANVIHTSTISFIGMLLNIHTNVVDLTQELSNKKYYQIDAYKASGAGGQHVNKTNSAVRITHTLLNIVVTSQAERSFIQNKAHAEKVLIQQIKYSFAYALTSILNNSLGNINTNRNAKDVTFNYKRNIFTLHNEYKYNFSINCLKNKNYGQFLLNSIIK